MTIYEDNIPKELINVPNWVGWREVNLKGKLSKIPIDATTGRWAKVNDPSTWSSFKDAVDIYIRREVDGIGFVFSKHDDFIGVDLDDCLDEKGELTVKARRIFNVLESYTEISPSGKGLHIIVKSFNKTAIPGIRRKGIEIYPTGRFFTITSNLFKGSKKAIAERHLEIAFYVGELVDIPPSVKKIPANIKSCPLCFKFERTGTHAKACARHPEYAKTYGAEKWTRL